MRVFYDFEFVEQGSQAPLIPVSLGMVAEDGRSLYIQFLKGLAPAQMHPWLSENVVPHLDHLECAQGLIVPGGGHFIGGKEENCPWRFMKEARQDVYDFLNVSLLMSSSKLELWGYYADYDHVLYAQLFGKMIDLPEGFPMWTHDIKQEVWRQEVTRGKQITLPKQIGREHHALEDARWNQACFQFLYPDGLPELGR